jgi:outer membrane protein TolC
MKLFVSLLLLCLFFFAPADISRAGENPEVVVRLSLSDAVSRAVEKNPDIIIERFSEQVFRQKVDEEQGMFDPKLVMEIETSRNEVPNAEVFYSNGQYLVKSDTAKIGLQGKAPLGTLYGVDLSVSKQFTTSEVQTLSPHYSSTLSLNITQPLLKNYGREITKIRIHLAEKGSLIASYKTLQQTLDSVAAVEQEYWQFVYASESIKLHKDSVALARKLLQESEIKLKAGEIAPYSVVQAKAAIAGFQEDLRVAENNKAKVENSLKLLLGLEEDRRLMVTDEPSRELQKADVENAVKVAFQKRPELHIASLELEQKAYEVKFTKNQRLPSLDIVGEYGFKGLSGSPSNFSSGTVSSLYTGKDDLSDSFDDFFTKEGQENWMVGLRFEMPLGNRQAKSRYNQAVFAKKKAEATYSALRKQISNDVSAAVFDLESNAAGIKSAQSGVRLATELLYREERKFSAGESTGYNVLLAQKELTEQRNRELYALIAYNQAWSKFRRAMGVSLDEYKIEFRQ